MNIITIYLITAVLSLVPISELRGGIPYAIANGIPWYWAYLAAVICNILVAPLCWVFIATLHKLLYGKTPDKGIRLYKKFFDRFIIKARKKLSASLEKWGWIGIALFVAIPLPVTGAWTGTIGSWVLGVSRKRTLLSVSIGVIIAGIIVTAVTVLGITTLNIFIRGEPDYLIFH